MNIALQLKQQWLIEESRALAKQIRKATFRFWLLRNFGITRLRFWDYTSMACIVILIACAIINQVYFN
jgi:hypothetical protein